MTAIEKLFRFRCYQTDGTTVDWTETVDIEEVGPVGGQRVEPKDATTSALPWTVTITDVAEDITARLADSDGRAQLLRRLADLSVSTDGGSTYTVLATGRIDAVEMAGVSAFRFTVTDERLIERTTRIFEATNTTSIVPPGVTSAWRDYSPRTTRVIVASVSGGDTLYTIYGGPIAVNRSVVDVLEDDVVDTPAASQNNFRTLHANIDGTDRNVERINLSPTYDPVRDLREQSGDEVLIRNFWVDGYADPGGVDTIRDIYLHMPDSTCSTELPLHIGGQNGIDPFTLVKNIYDGSYQDASNPATVKYDSAAFTAYDESTNPGGLVDNPRFPKMHFRITGPANMAEWLETNIYGPLGVVPLINADGEVEPVVARMPATDDVPDPDTLFEFTKANLALPHPGWLNQGRDQITVLRAVMEYARPARQSDNNRGLDGLVLDKRIYTIEHDNVSTVGRVVHEITTAGVQRVTSMRPWATAWARELFDRFGDGPVYARDCVGLSGSESVTQGDWVVLDLDTYPALQNQSRSGKRLLQVMNRTDYPEGPRFDLLEAGPNSQPLSTPSVSAAASSEDPHNAISVTVSGLGTGEGYELHVAVNGTEPAEKSPLWQNRTIRGTGNETITVGLLPSGSTIWVRVRATQLNRISSDWSTADSQATTALTAPSGVADSGLSADAATVSWTNGETDYDIAVDLDGTFVARLAAGSTSYRFSGLDASTAYTAGVKHIDDYGGESSRATDGFTTTGTAETLLPPNAVAILVGEAA